MRLALTGRNLDITPALRQLVTRRLAKLDRLLHDDIISAQVVLRLEKHRHKTDVLVHTSGNHELSGHGEDGSWPVSIGHALTKVEQQAAKLKGKREGQRRMGRAVIGEPGEAVGTARRNATTTPATRKRDREDTPILLDTDPAAVRVVRIRRSTPKPMRLEDAVLKVDEAPGSVLAFRDPSLDRIQVLVRRADGSLGLLDPDV
ncbi:MAG TPA: ribosome-associated translation inhibitor RaiA [Luteitalea sp.]|nr:ribosome-associated translation inhibitor RaiA [Luteitalea sp.]